jgi:ketosteroid isomerase-like protein
MSDAILAANRRFYEAFARADLGAMDDLWAREVPVTCVHPGWTPMVERDEIMQSWQAILAGTAPREVSYGAAEAFPGEDMGYVLCSETIGDTELIATNVFVRESNGEWKMVHHHAGPLVRPRAPQPPPTRGSMAN